MSTHSMVGKPITKRGKVVGFNDVIEIPTNEIFKYNRRGYATLQPDDIAALDGAPASASTGNGDQELATMTVKQLRVIAEPLGVSGRKKADLVEAIETARDELAAAE